MMGELEKKEDRSSALESDEGTIFLSYSHSDSERVHPVRDALIKLGYDIWIDQSELVAGDDLFKSINAGLQASRVFIAFVGQYYFEDRKYTEYEFSAAFHLAVGASDWRVIVVLLEENLTLPPLIAGRLYVPYQGPEKTAEEIAKAIGHFSKTDGPVYGEKSKGSMQETTVIDFESLKDKDVHDIVNAFLENRNALLRAPGIVLKLEVRLPKKRSVMLEFLRSVIDDEGVRIEFEQQMTAIELSQRWIRNIKEKLMLGLLGQFEESYKMKLEQDQRKLDEAFNLLRCQLEAIVEDATLRHH